MVGKKRWKVVESFLYFGGREWLRGSEHSNTANQRKSTRACALVVLLPTHFLHEQGGEE